MNPVLVFLIILATVVLWYLLSFLFYPLGKLLNRIHNDAINEMNRDDEESNNKSGENKE